MKAFAEAGQKVVESMRSNSRENTTVVTTISANGATWAPTIIFKGQRLQPDWFAERNGPKDASLTTKACSTESRTHILVLDGHASHMSYELPSHTSHITQPLDVVAFGTFKKEVTKVLQDFYHANDGLLPLKRDVPGVIAAAWQKSFTPERNKASFGGAGLWPVDMDRALTRLQGTAKRKERPTGRPPLEDVPIAMTHEQLEEAIGERCLRQLKAGGHTITGLKVGTVMLGGLLTQRKRAKKLATSRGSLGLPHGGNINSEEFLAKVD
ncbi:unnamed protein product [Ectocarpus sp. CCAP 1310/34]|nr:unnamed protein product [Ectocarpus sp. CCAP 1310/34]